MVLAGCRVLSAAGAVRRLSDVLMSPPHGLTRRGKSRTRADRNIVVTESRSMCAGNGGCHLSWPPWQKDRHTHIRAQVMARATGAPHLDSQCDLQAGRGPGALSVEDGLHRALRAALHQRSVLHARVLELE